MTEYKVWIHIEGVDEEKGHHQEVDKPREVERFSSKRKARQCVAQLLSHAGTPCRGLHIDPSPQDDLYRVVYAIDVVAVNAQAAARQTYDIMTDPDSLAPILQVLDHQGNQTDIDLSLD